MNFAIKNTIKAMIMKLITAPRSAPQEMTIAPIFKTAVCHAPPGINAVIIGIIKSFTNAFTSATTATPITKAIAEELLYTLSKIL